MVCLIVAVSPTAAPDADVTVTVCVTFQALAPEGAKVSVSWLPSVLVSVSTVACVVSPDATATVTLPVGADFSFTV